MMEVCGQPDAAGNLLRGKKREELVGLRDSLEAVERRKISYS
jgi:hypothetical protein